MARRGRVSATARTVAVMRSLATAEGVVDDHVSRTLLSRPWRGAEWLVRRFGPPRVRRHRAIAYVAARTRFFDTEVVDALDAGIVQVVVIGAGYDTRSWRLARAGVRFFEVDLPATQADKRRRAPAGGPVYVEGDLAAGDLLGRLRDVGFDPGAATLFTLEGVTMYLTRDALAAALAQLSALAATRSRLAVNFGVGFAQADRAREGVVARCGRSLVTALREPLRFEPTPGEVPGFLESCGWRVERLVAGPGLAAELLRGSSLGDASLNPGACAVRAVLA